MSKIIGTNPRLLGRRQMESLGHPYFNFPVSVAKIKGKSAPLCVYYFSIGFDFVVRGSPMLVLATLSCGKLLCIHLAHIPKV